MKIKMNKIFLYVLIVIIFVVFYSYRERSISKEESLNLMGKRFELQEDSFLFQWPDTKLFDIDVPGKLSGFSGVPISMEEFKKYPDTWYSSPEYLQFHGVNEDFLHVNIVGILKKGTILKVVKIKHHYFFDAGKVRPVVLIENGESVGKEVNISLIVINPYYNKFKTKWLKELD